MGTQGQAMVLPAGSVPKVILSGPELFIAIVSIIEGEGVIVCYPDGFTRHHQVGTVIDLLAKVEGQLRARYNLTSFKFESIPADLVPGETIKIGEINYA
jgi:hypothetical protein